MKPEKNQNEKASEPTKKDILQAFAEFEQKRDCKSKTYEYDLEEVFIEVF